MLAFNAMKPARLSIALPVIDDSEYLKRPTQRAYTNIIAIVFFYMSSEVLIFIWRFNFISNLAI